MTIKTFDDSGRFLLTIEPVDAEAEALIKQIKKICGLDNSSDIKIEGLTAPELPAANDCEEANEMQASNPQPEESESELPPTANVGAGYLAFYETMKQIKEGSITGEERAEAIQKVKRFAANMKARVPSGDNLRFCIDHLEEMFNSRVEKAALDKFGMTKGELLWADEETLKGAYVAAMEEVRFS